MPTITNDIDLILQAATTRFPPPDDRALLLGCTSPGGFKVAANGTPTPSTIVFTPILIGMTGTVSYSLTGGLALTYSGNEGTLSFANMTANSGTVTVNLTVDGVAHSRSITISKVFDGSSGTGTPGQRGAGQYYVAGSGWSDLAADLATPGDTVLDDQVTIWNGTNYAEVKRWNGTAWVPAGLHMPGDVIVPGTLTGNRIKAGTLELYKPDGTPIITLGGLQTGFEAPGTKNSEQTLAALGQKTFRVVAQGGSATSVPAPPGLYLSGVLISGVGRSYVLQVIRSSDGTLLTSQTYDVFGDGEGSGGRNAATLAGDLNALGSDVIVVVYSHDEPQARRLLGGLDAAMYRCGASRAVFGSPQFKYRSAYILVGVPGCGEGNGAEAYQGAVDDDPNAWCDIAFNVVSGSLLGVSSSYTPKTLTDYGYTGALDATRGAPAGTTVGGTLAETVEANANAAIYAIENISSDNVISKGEKPGFMLSWSTIAGEVNGILIQADNLTVNRAAYYDAYIALNNVIPSGWNDVALDTPVDGPMLRAEFTNYYTAKEALRSAMAAAAAAKGDAAQQTANSAANAIPGINSAIADKLSKTGNEEIYGQKSLMTQYALLVGAVNDGIIYGSTGLYGRNGGYTKFSIGANGRAIFADQLIAAWGTFGAVSIAAGGSLGIGATGYNTNPGIFLDYAVNPRMSIRTANGATFLCDPANNVLQFSGGTMIGVDLQSPVIAPITGGTMSNINVTSTSPLNASVGTRTAVGAGGTAPYKYLWGIEGDVYNIVGEQIGIYIEGATTSATVSLKAVSGGAYETFAVTATCTILDASGLSGRASFNATITYI